MFRRRKKFPHSVEVSFPGRPESETPLFDAAVLATGVNPEPYEMDHVDQAFHSAHVTGPMVDHLDLLAAPLSEVPR